MRNRQINQKKTHDAISTKEKHKIINNYYFKGLEDEDDEREKAVCKKITTNNYGISHCEVANESEFGVNNCQQGAEKSIEKLKTHEKQKN